MGVGTVQVADTCTVFVFNGFLSANLLLTGIGLHIKFRVKCIEIPAVQLILGNPQTFTKPLVMDHFPGPEELNGFTDIIILHNAQDVVIGTSGLLLSCHILVEIRDHIALGLEFARIKGDTACCLGPDTCGMVNVVRAKALFYQLVCRQVPGKLMDNGCNNLKVGQLFRSNIGEGCLALLVRHGVALGQVTHGRAHLAVRHFRNMSAEVHQLLCE